MKKITFIFLTSIISVSCSNSTNDIMNNSVNSDSPASNYVEYVTPEFIRLEILKDARNKYGHIYSSLVEYSLALKLKPSTTKASLLSAKLTFPEDQTFLEGLALDNNLTFNN